MRRDAFPWRTCKNKTRRCLRINSNPINRNKLLVNANALKRNEYVDVYTKFAHINIFVNSMHRNTRRNSRYSFSRWLEYRPQICSYHFCGCINLTRRIYKLTQREHPSDSCRVFFLTSRYALNIFWTKTTIGRDSDRPLQPLCGRDCFTWGTRGSHITS